MRWLLWFLPVRIFLWGLTLFLLWQVVVFVRAWPAEIDPRVLQLVERAAQEAATSLEEYRRQSKRIGVVHFVNDPTDQVTAAFVRAFDAPGAWTVDERSVIQRFLADIGRAVARATTPEEVAFAGRQVELDWVVMGRVHEGIALEDSARVELSIWIYDLGQGAWLYRERWSDTYREEYGLPTLARGAWARPWVRVLLWLFITALLPWITAPLIYHALEHLSNVASALLLAGYGAANLAVLLALMNFHVAGRASAVGLVLAILVATLYNYWACETIAEAAE